jgi:hypothetical protein
MMDKQRVADLEARDRLADCFDHSCELGAEDRLPESEEAEHQAAHETKPGRQDQAACTPIAAGHRDRLDADQDLMSFGTGFGTLA